MRHYGPWRSGLIFCAAPTADIIPGIPTISTAASANTKPVAIAISHRDICLSSAWSEAFPSRIEALEAERIVGGWSRGKKEALIAGDWSMISFLARPPKERFVRDGFSIALETNGGEDISGAITP